MSQFPADRPDPVPSDLAASDVQSPADPAPVETDRGGASPPKKPRRKPVRMKGPQGSRLIRHFKVDHRLTADDRVKYEALLLDPRQTADSLLEWLHARGYTDLSRAGVARHRRQFEFDVKGIRRDARVAGQFAALARAQGGASALADAGQFRFEQMFVEQLFRMKKTDARAAKEWVEFGRAMASLLENRQQVETIKGRGAGGKDGQRGTTGDPHADVADRLCKLLGVTPENAALAGPLHSNNSPPAPPAPSAPDEPKPATNDSSERGGKAAGDDDAGYYSNDVWFPTRRPSNN